VTRNLALEPHHDGSPLYVSTQAPLLGDVVRVRLRIPAAFGTVASVHTRSNPDREPRFSAASVVATIDDWAWWEADVEVENPVHGYRFLVTMQDGRDAWVNATGVHWTETLDVEDFKLIAYPEPPTWGHSSVLYQIFPDRFARSAAADERELPEWAIPAEWDDAVVGQGPETPYQFFGGDLDGVVEHLDHLERLGVTTIYLTPVFPARSNHRYDASNFDEVDPLLGGDEALVRLTAAAHARGLKVIGDLTSNHSGDRHEWFQSALGDTSAPESAFYLWLDDEQTKYVGWLGVPSLPKFNWNSAELRRRFIEGPDSVVGTWLQEPYDLDGWRIDVANMTGRYLDQDLNHLVRQTIRRTMVDVDPDTLLLAESTNDAASDFQGDAWHGAMTYANFTRPLWGWLAEPHSPALGGIGFAHQRVPAYTGQQFYAAHKQFAAGFPWRVRLHNMNALNTHDTPRFRSVATPERVPVALGLSMTMPGIPVVFAGDEFGLEGANGEYSRTPIPWDRVEHAEPIIGLYADMIRMRREHPSLNDGGLRWLWIEDDAVVFVRENEEETVLVFASRNAVNVVLPFEAVPTGGTPILGDVEFFEDGSGVHLISDGPAFSAWRLPGVALPAFG
jgi:alpha-glucosidase